MNIAPKVRVSLTSRALATIIAVVTASGAVTSAATADPPSPSWAFPNGNLANTRVATGSTISMKNVSSLKEVWSFKLTGKAAKSLSQLGSLAETPIVVDNVVYVQDLRSDVYALSLTNGSLLWKYTVNKPEKSGPGPNGVAVADHVVYGLTPTSAFALNAENGHPRWVNKTILQKGQGTFGMQPQVANGRVYLASQYGSGPGGGVLFALNAASGQVLFGSSTRSCTPASA